MDEGILGVSELAGDRVVELRVVDELHVVGLITCEREGVVVGDEAPLGGVAHHGWHVDEGERLKDDLSQCGCDACDQDEKH